jgi:hypothetical protein
LDYIQWASGRERNAMKRWPWISLAVAAIAVLNPLGQDIIHAAFFSGEQLSRNIWQPFVYGAALILILLIALEWWIRKRRAARRAAA